MAKYPKNLFSTFSPNMLLFLKKLLDEKIFKTLFPIKKVIFIFVVRRPFPSDENGFLPVFSKIQLFLKKLLNNKIFSSSFVIKKVMLIFGARSLLSIKSLQVCHQNSFSRFSRKVPLFSKNCRIQNIQHLIPDKKLHIHFWCTMTPYRSHCNSAAVLQTK